jgi:GH15 family glucan-1,4-alpha-glucosidase
MRADGEWRPTRSARSSRSAAESDEVGNYVRSAGSRDLDASLLLGALMDFPASRDPQMTATISALRRELGHGALLGRYSGEDGLAGGGGAFLCCSFCSGSPTRSPAPDDRRRDRADGAA